MKILENINICVGRIVSYLIFIIITFMAYEVIARYLFRAPTLWINELCEYYFGTIVFLAGGYAYFKNAHVKVDVIYKMWPLKIRLMADSFTTVLILVFCAFFIIYGAQGAVRSIASSQTSGTMWNPPIWPMKLLIPIGFMLILLQAICNMYSIIAKLRESKLK